MQTHIWNFPDHKTGIDFVHTVHVDDSGYEALQHTSIALDNLANAAFCRIRAGWLKSILVNKLADSDPESEGILMDVTEKVTGTEPHAYLRTYDEESVNNYINLLNARANELREAAS